MEIVSAPLKGVFFTHFILCVWALQAAMPVSYAVYNMVLFLTLLWGMHSRDSEEPIFMALAINAASILLDIVTIIIYFPAIEGLNSATRNFSLGIAILNLIIRPVTCVILFRIRSEREGNYNNYGVPGLGDYFGRRGPYENIDQPLPQNIPPADGDLSSPHHQSYDQSKMNLP